MLDAVVYKSIIILQAQEWGAGLKQALKHLFSFWVNIWPKKNYYISRPFLKMWSHTFAHMGHMGLIILQWTCQMCVCRQRYRVSEKCFDSRKLPRWTVSCIETAFINAGTGQQEIRAACTVCVFWEKNIRQLPNSKKILQSSITESNEMCHLPFGGQFYLKHFTTPWAHIFLEWTTLLGIGAVTWH